MPAAFSSSSIETKEKEALIYDNETVFKAVVECIWNRFLLFQQYSTSSSFDFEIDSLDLSKFAYFLIDSKYLVAIDGYTLVVRGPFGKYSWKMNLTYGKKSSHVSSLDLKKFSKIVQANDQKNIELENSEIYETFNGDAFGEDFVLRNQELVEKIMKIANALNEKEKKEANESSLIQHNTSTHSIRDLKTLFFSQTRFLSGDNQNNIIPLLYNEKLSEAIGLLDQLSEYEKILKFRKEKISVTVLYVNNQQCIKEICRSQVSQEFIVFMKSIGEIVRFL